MKRRELLAMIAALPFAARAAALREFGGELVAGLLERAPSGVDGSNPRTLDPPLARTRLEREIASALHLPLFGAPSPGRPFGALVESATASRDARTWSVTLRAGLRFHDGSPIR